MWPFGRNNGPSTAPQLYSRPDWWTAHTPDWYNNYSFNDADIEYHEKNDTGHRIPHDNKFGSDSEAANEYHPRLASIARTLSDRSAPLADLSDFGAGVTASRGAGISAYGPEGKKGTHVSKGSDARTRFSGGGSKTRSMILAETYIYRKSLDANDRKIHIKAGRDRDFALNAYAAAMACGFEKITGFEPKTQAERDKVNRLAGGIYREMYERLEGTTPGFSPTPQQLPGFSPTPQQLPGFTPTGAQGAGTQRAAIGYNNPGQGGRSQLRGITVNNPSLDNPSTGRPTSFPSSFTHPSQKP